MTTLQAMFVGFVVGVATLRIVQVIAEAIWQGRMERRGRAIVYHWTNVRSLLRERARRNGRRDN